MLRCMYLGIHVATLPGRLGSVIFCLIIIVDSGLGVAPRVTNHVLLAAALGLLPCPSALRPRAVTPAGKGGEKARGTIFAFQRPHILRGSAWFPAETCSDEKTSRCKGAMRVASREYGRWRLT